MSAPSNTGRGSGNTRSQHASTGSSTVTTTQAGPSHPLTLRSGTLRLRAEAEPQQQPDSATQRRIQWAEDVIDNEGMGKKSSKVCCIYHKPREAGESSDESSSSSDSESDSEPDTSRAQSAHARSDRSHRHTHQHDDDSHACDHNHGQSADSPKAKGKQKERKRSPNAYERMPKQKQPRAPK